MYGLQSCKLATTMWKYLFQPQWTLHNVCLAIIDLSEDLVSTIGIIDEELTNKVSDYTAYDQFILYFQWIEICIDHPTVTPSTSNFTTMKPDFSHYDARIKVHKPDGHPEAKNAVWM